MAKQTKQYSDDARTFFDEMEEKMEAQNSKRRKLSKKPGHSQPELSFLLFNPKANSGKENICYFNNKCFSQPTCNKSSLNKKSWRPPMKALDGSDTLELSCLTKETLYEKDKKPIKDGLSSFKDTNCKISAQKEEYDTNVSVDLPSVEGLFSSLLNPPVDKSQPVTIDLSNLNTSVPESNENNYSFQQKTSIAEISLASETVSTVLSLANNAHEDIDPLEGGSSSISEKIILKSVDNILAPIALNKEDSGESVCNKTLSNICETIADINYVDKKSIKEPLNEPISEEKALANYHIEILQVENVNKENINSKREETMNFAEMLTQENFKLRDRNILEVQKETECDDKNTKLHYNKEDEIGSDTTKIELKDNKSTSDLNANEDIINSIDMILSEGQNMPSNLCQEKKDLPVCKNNENHQNCQTLVDSVFENSSSNDETECYDSNNSNIIDNKISKNAKQCTRAIANKPLCKNSTVVKPDNIKEGFSNIDQKGDNTLKEVAVDSLSLPEKKLEQNVFVKSKFTNNDPVLSHNKNIENIQDEEIVADDDEGSKNVCDVGDEDYSCSMISNSQLLEIEKIYYEMPPKKESTQANFNGKFYNQTITNKKLVSVSTQTEIVFPYTSTEQCVPLKNPPLQWPSKIVETQRRLREVIQEIHRLNATLSKVRHEIWPQKMSKK